MVLIALFSAVCILSIVVFLINYKYQILKSSLDLANTNISTIFQNIIYLEASKEALLDIMADAGIVVDIESLNNRVNAHERHIIEEIKRLRDKTRLHSGEEIMNEITESFKNGEK